MDESDLKKVLRNGNLSTQMRIRGSEYSEGKGLKA